MLSSLMQMVVLSPLSQRSNLSSLMQMVVLSPLSQRSNLSLLTQTAKGWSLRLILILTPLRLMDDLTSVSQNLIVPIFRVQFLLFCTESPMEFSEIFKISKCSSSVRPSYKK
jgi:hypothetical protein